MYSRHMQYTVRLPQPMKLYYSSKVYSPHYSSIETILLVDKLIKDGQKPDVSVMDVGCGSGIIGLGVKLLNPEAEVSLSDIDPEAVRITNLNAKRLGLDVWVRTCDLLPPGRWDIIAANLPTYTGEDMEQELHGPPNAYYAGDDPLALYRKLFDKAKCKALVCECQAKYQEPFLKLAEEKGWRLILRTEFSFAFLAPKQNENQPQSSSK